MLREGGQDRLAGSASYGRTTCQPVLTTFPQPFSLLILFAKYGLYVQHTRQAGLD